MSSLARREIARFTVALVSHRAGTAIAALAYRVRAVARVSVSAAWYLGTVVARGRVKPAAAVRYAAECLTAATGAGSRAARGAIDPAPAATVFASDPAERVIVPGAAPVSVLTDPRVRALQASIIRAVFAARFSLRLKPAELSVLASYSSVAWLIRNLLTAAGYRGAAPPRELIHRCAVVYPVLCRALALRLVQARLETGRASAPGVLGRGRPPGGGIEPDGEITRSVYPDSIVIERLKVRAESARRAARASAVRFRNAERLAVFSVYMAAVTLVVRSAPRTARRAGPMLARIGRMYR